MNDTYGGHHMAKYLLRIYPFASFAKWSLREPPIPNQNVCTITEYIFEEKKTVSIINQFVTESCDEIYRYIAPILMVYPNEAFDK